MDVNVNLLTLSTMFHHETLFGGEGWFVMHVMVKVQFTTAAQITG
jgi:hypothetical protein